MNDHMYQLALTCKRISDKEIGIDKTLIPIRNILFTDYTIKGSIDEYRKAIAELQLNITDKYPHWGHELKVHNDEYANDKIIHYTAMKTIVDCILSLEEHNNSKRIFISHSSNDKEIIEKFIDNILQLGIGLSIEDIFCSSIEELGIKNGDDIREHIKKNLQKTDFSFLMISKNYKESEICLNEMGAVWATNNNVRYYLLPSVDFNEIGWLCDTNKADKLCNPVVLDAIEKELTSFYGLPHRGGIWSRQRQNFVEYLNSKE